MRTRWVLALLVVSVIVAGCLKPPAPPAPPAPTGSQPPPSPPAASPSPSPSPSAGPTPSPPGSPSIPSPYDLFSSNVKVSIDGDVVVLVSDSLPNHTSAYWPTSNPLYEPYTDSGFHKNPGTIATRSQTFRIPLHPSPATTHAQTPLGPMGIARNGVPFFNQYAAGRSALDDEIVSFDQGKGHPQQQGQYHYHVEPTRLTAVVGRDAFLGVLLDGYPVYGPVKDGKAVTNADLDAYHGLTAVTPEYPDGTYQYRITADDPYINGAGFYGTAGTVS